jgi:FKBP-type peptidyl-prolyl cis-trans isomerase FklB
MKLSLVAATAAVAVVGSALVFGQNPAPAPATTPAQGGPEMKDLKSKVSYGFGLNIGKKFKRDGIELDPQLVYKGMVDGLAGAKALLTETEIQEAMTAFDQQLREKQAELAQKQAELSKKEGVKFLAENKSKPGVITLPSGLQYKVLKEGTGVTPKATDSVTVNYEGRLVDETVFDSSIQRKEPLTIRVDGVIKGWTEALQRMKVGSKYRLFIPTELAYGATPRPGGGIPPYAALVFDVELLGIGSDR